MHTVNDQSKLRDIVICSLIILLPGALPRNFLYAMHHELLGIRGVCVSVEDGWIAVGFLLIQIFLMVEFLDFKKKDFQDDFFKVTRSDTLLGFIIFAVISMQMDFFYLVAEIFFGKNLHMTFGNMPLGVSDLHSGTPVIFYSVLNAFTEEFFFLFVCMRSAQLPSAFLYSLLVRFMMHTHQGIAIALAASLSIGLTNAFVYKFERKNLYVFTLAHGLGNIFGFTILDWISLLRSSA